VALLGALWIPLVAAAASDATPQQVSAVSAGFSHALAVDAEGFVWGWGSNSSYQLGGGTTQYRQISPVRIPGIQGVTAVAAGSSTSFALRQDGKDGTVWTWGDNTYGQLGDGTFTQRLTPVQVSGLSGATAVVAGPQNQSMALLGDGTLYGWGFNSNGQLTGTSPVYSTPVQMLTGVVSFER
jgi:alpha-tubulin suppressor-like RCC1 family protein